MPNNGISEFPTATPLPPLPSTHLLSAYNNQESNAYVRVNKEIQINDTSSYRKTSVNATLYIFAACAALNSANLGCDIGVNTNAAKILQSSMNLSDVQLEFFMGSLNLFAMIGALCSHMISDRYGRRGSFLIAAIGFICGVSVISLSKTYTSLMIGRMLAGLGTGFGFAMDPIYISEISPASKRGQLVTWSDIATNIGLVMGFSSGIIFLDFPDDQAWRLMFRMCMVLPIIMIFLTVCVLPESPRWLVQHGLEKEAVETLKKIYPNDFDVDVILAEIKDSIKNDTEAECALGWDFILCPTPAFQRILIVGIGTALAKPAVGIDAIQYFLMFIIDDAGIKSRVGQSVVLIFLGMLKLVFIIIASKLFDKRGRRPMFLASFAGMIVSLLILSFEFSREHHSPVRTIFALGLFLSSFSIGLGPGSWLIPSEIFPTIIRGKAMSVATFLNRVTGTVMSSSLLSVVGVLSWSGYFLMLSIICFIFLVFFWMYLPETKGRRLEDMVVYFAEITGDLSILDVEKSAKHRSTKFNNGYSSVHDEHAES